MTAPAIVAPVAGRAEPRVLVALQDAALAAFVIACFCPFLIERVTSPAIFAALVLWVFVLVELARRRAAQAALGVWIGLPVVLLVVAYALNTLPEVQRAALGALPGAFGQFGVELPVAAVAGALLVRSGRARWAATSVRATAVLCALGAVLERRTGRQLFLGNVVNTNFGYTQQVQGAALTDSGALRGIVAADHPLVLALLLATTVAIVLVGPLRPVKLIEVGLLLAGIWATDSSGPLAVAVLAVAVRLVVALADRAAIPVVPSRRLVRIVAVVAVSAFLLAATFLWHPVIDPSVLDQSTLYRFALFSFIPVAIAARPLGFGLIGPPRGTFVVESPGHPLDIAATVDSELVLMVLRFGLVGLLVFLAIAWIGIRGVLDRRALRRGGGALAVMTACGAIVAIEVWPTVSAAWVLLMGFTLALLVESRRARDREPRP
ncbi:hypothetical protein [Amnibacterium setariae]|uniref:hypothetical protein n=1 Tax=Amnibacterium setariae TaxID=2306585 RepID=UPI0013141ECF|nr:hypothetical protein [Amnibacterium setariae]